MAAPREGSKAKHAPDPNPGGIRRGGLPDGGDDFDPERPDGFKSGLTVNPEGGLSPKGHDYSEFPFTQLARLTKLLRGEEVPLQTCYWDAHDCLGWAGETFVGPRQVGVGGAGNGSAGRKMEAVPEDVSDERAAEMLEALLARHGGGESAGEEAPEAPRKGRRPAPRKAAPQPRQAVPPWLVPILLKVFERILDRLMRDQG